MSSNEREDIRIRYLKVDTANVSDVLDELGLMDQGLSSEIQAITGTRLAGWAYTIAGEMASYEGRGDNLKMDACRGISSSEVSVWSGGGEGICYFGELIALGMIERGSVGAIFDGGVRDTRVLASHGFVTFGRYRAAVQSITRWRVTSYQVPILLPGATVAHVEVSPGDFILADEDGAVVVPADVVKKVLELSEEIMRTEAQVREALKTGLSLSEALDQFGHV